MVALRRANQSRTHPQTKTLVSLGDGAGGGGLVGEVDILLYARYFEQFIYPMVTCFIIIIIIISAAMGPCKYPHNVIRLTGERGNLSSPLYPRKFHDIINCTWVITAPEGNFVKLRIKSLDFGRYSGCSLTIRDGPSSASALLKSFQINYESSVFSSSPHLWVQFISTQSYQGASFYAEFEAVKQRKAEISFKRVLSFTFVLCFICFDILEILRKLLLSVNDVNVRRSRDNNYFVQLAFLNFMT